MNIILLEVHPQLNIYALVSVLTQTSAHGERKIGIDFAKNTCFSFVLYHLFVYVEYMLYLCACNKCGSSDLRL